MYRRLRFSFCLLLLSIAMIFLSFFFSASEEERDFGKTHEYKMSCFLPSDKILKRTLSAWRGVDVSFARGGVKETHRVSNRIQMTNVCA